MDRHDWDRRYGATDLVWTAEPNRWLVAEAAGLLAGPGPGPRLWRGPERGVAGPARVAGDGRRLLTGRAGEGAPARGRLGWAGGRLGRGGCPHVPPGTGGLPGLVLLAYVHLPEPDRGAVHRAAARAVAPGGVLLVVGHDTTNLRDGVGGPQDPAVLFTPADVVDDLASVDGLEVERAERVLRPVPTPDGERQAVDALVRVHRRAAHPPG